MTSKDIIYYLSGKCLFSEKLQKSGCKIGSTKHILPRMKTYQTGYSDRVPLICYYEIDKNCYEVDNKIKTHFDKCRLNTMGSEGGTEIYDSEVLTIKKLEEFFKMEGIFYVKREPNELDFEMYTERLSKEERIDISKEDDIKEDLFLNKKIHKIPRDYQEEIINNSIEYFKTKNKGMLILICGTGKTLISLWITLKMNYNKILIGVPNTLLLTQWAEVIEGNNEYYGVIPNIRKILLVNSDCDINKIKTYLKENKKCIVITTYHSSFKVLEATKQLNYEFDIKINDECHHLTTSNMEIANTKRTFVQMLNIKSKKQLSLTATLKQIEMNEKTPNVVSNENKEIFGEIIDRRNMIWAINKNIICDYVVQTIITEEIELEEIILKFEIKDEDEKRLFLSAFVALKSIEENHSHHLLIYTNKQENASKIINYIKLLIENKYFSNDGLYFNSYHSNIDDEIQKEIIKNFDAYENGIISCVYSLGEGWDFPKLDGVVFAETMSSNIRIVQSSLRASRKNKNEPNKISKLIIPELYNERWLDNDNEDFKKIKEIVYQLGLEDETIMMKINVVKIDLNIKKVKDKQKNKLNTSVFIGEIQNELTEKLKLHTEPRQTLDINYEKTKKIILEKNIIFNNKDDYFTLCNKDIRLSRKPEEKFMGQFSTWFDYLGLNKENYYDIKTCIDKVDEYINENKIFDYELTNITKTLQNKDKRFPPFDMWTDCYDINDLSEIIHFD